MATKPPDYKPAKPRGHEFTQDEIDRALTALALNSGNSARARETLEHDNTFPRLPSERVLRQWKQLHADRYNQIRTERRPTIEAAAVNDYAAIVARTNQVVLAGIERTATGLDELDAKDAASTVKNLAIAGGVAADKLLVFTDRPNQITERRDPDDILRALERVIPRADADSTATEEPASSSLTPESAVSNARELNAGTNSQP